MLAEETGRKAELLYGIITMNCNGRIHAFYNTHLYQEGEKRIGNIRPVASLCMHGMRPC